MRRTILLILAAGCSSDSPASVDAPPGTNDSANDAPFQADAPPSNLTVTSTAISEGAAIPAVHTCDGANTSPPLAWTGVPAGTLSFAVVLRDETNALIHSVLYDVPANLSALPADIDKVFAPPDLAGAHQTRTFGGNSFGYTGPCPPPGGGPHTYALELYALDVAALPGADMNTTTSQARSTIQMHDIASAKLTGTYQR
jgi:Raf kinase inhibitor-like YbhB/YbcL family protein